MEFLRHYLLTILIFLPAAGALALMFVRGPKALKWTTLGVTIGTFLASILLFATFDWHAGQTYAYADEGGVVQMAQRADWIKPFNIHYLVAIDGLNFPLVLLTTFIFMLASVASWKIDKGTKEYMVLLLMLETAVLGLFLSLDLFLFYVFFEISLVPTYFLIGVWGRPRKEYAGLKYFIYSLLGSIALLVAMIGIYLHAHSFDLVKLAGRDFPEGRKFFILLMVAFLIRLAGVPFHSWLIDAHAEAPTPVNMILTGVLLKIGGYGIFRIAYPLFPEAATSLWMILAILGVISILYGAMCAMAQTDFNRLLAYSSISIMGFVTLGAAMMNETAMNGAMFMMIAHGITGAAMFFVAGVIYNRAHHRHISRMGGIFSTMPIFSGLGFVALFSGLGLPGLCGFIGEILVLLGSFQAARPGGILFEAAEAHGLLHTFLLCVWLLAGVACFGIVVTAGYILWTIQRVFLGTARPEHNTFRDIDSREMSVMIPLTAMIILLGILPTGAFFIFTSQTVAAIFAMLMKGHLPII